MSRQRCLGRRILFRRGSMHLRGICSCRGRFLTEWVCSMHLCSPAAIMSVGFFRRLSRVVGGLVSVEKRRQGTFFALLLSLLKDYSYNFSNLRVILMSGRLEGISQRVRALWVWCILQGVCVLQVLRSCSTEERCR